ncbi:hypothetical protein HMPREF9309_01427 [Campylobacter ureolyticus ACS-301-V-Sch3b]|uniref:Phage tail protein n=1 Tax=Campylobacter ureolyticus ACS-301-V-Sch3b TaxID=883165 RepID=S3XFP6_9BACT|nr:hypothetical protein [Campylobacter ureolyticus]EPH07353.1 hypothetical protein HMPREF9309_01662 [Campylobacter ureolyticus ACS-301-V-Sch3b]EPH08172.1 hypothetical protein HMPREF9309_01427 [Campylobacter ureolyticus ACS-301-V-Sch3b]
MARVLSRTGLKVGIETTSGTYKEPTQVLKVTSNIQPKVSFDEVEIPNFGFFGGAKDVVTIADWGQMEIEASTCLYKDINFYDNLFLMCNLKSKEDTTKKTITYTPDTHSPTTGSVDLILPDRKFKGKGAKAGFSISGKVGDKLEMKFNIKAAYDGEVVEPQSITDIKAGEALLIRRLGAMSLNGVQINLSEFSFDMGNVINYEKFTNIGEFHMSDYEPKLTLKMRLESGGDSGFREFASGDVMSFEAIFKDSAGKDIFKLSIPRAKISKTPEFEDMDGIYVIEREFLALSNKGDDNFSLTYYKE